MSPVMTIRSGCEGIRLIDDHVVELAAELPGHVQVGEVGDRQAVQRRRQAGSRSVFRWTAS